MPFVSNQEVADEGVSKMYSLKKRLAAEFFDTFWLVFGGCGSAVLTIAQLRLFWIAPILGAYFSGLAHRAWHSEKGVLSVANEEERPLKRAASR